MGSDDLHKKRKMRKAGELHRRRAKRAPYDVVLIVCEGGKTEPIYFTEMRMSLGLRNANIKICGQECGSSPLNVVDFALKTYRKEKSFSYDRVYCVFDRDQHSQYHAALDKIKRARLKKGGQIFAITSNPCFEYWLLLHYEYTTRCFVATQKKSLCEQVISELTKHFINYEKGQNNIFAQTRFRVESAIKNAKLLKQYHHTSGTNSPATNIHELVEYLHELSDTQRQPERR